MEILNRKKAAALAFGGMMAIYMLFFPTGAVRLSMAVHGYPLAAVSTRIESGFENSSLFLEGYDPMPSFVETLPFHVEKPPVERATLGEARNWAAYRIGPVCIGRYWGDC